MSNRPVNMVGYGPHKIITEAEHSKFGTSLTSNHFHAWLYDNGCSNFHLGMVGRRS